MGKKSGYAFLWKQETGSEYIKFYLEDEGIDMTDWFLSYAYDISDDGKSIVGVGTNPFGKFEGWLVRFLE